MSKCTACGDKLENTAKDFTKAVIEINNPETLVLLRKVVIPASMGDDTDVVPAVGKYHNVILQYEANGHIYLYSSDGIPTAIEANIPQEVLDQIAELENDVDSLERADEELQREIDDLKNSPDVVDIVATYADLQAYDTSTLGDKDVIRVLEDETHSNESAYYRWDKTNSQWVFIGAVEGYYTKDQTDDLLDAKQDLLTPGENITIEDESGALVISATDTKYTAGSNVQISPQNVISATDTTYTHFTGATASTDGIQGLVPGPLAGDEDKYLKGDGTWGTVQAGPTVVQTTGTSTTDVMSQNATTSMIYADPSSKANIRIGLAASLTGGTDYTIAIGKLAVADSVTAASLGYYARARGIGAIALGREAQTTIGNRGSIALGSYSNATQVGEMNIGSSATTHGYNNSNYRLLSGLYEGQSAHDAATYGQVISYSAINGAGAPTTATEGKYVGQLYYDTTNEAMYFLKAIDTTTDPATYTWEALGGGSSVNVVQTTGTSTTDVMSQNAVTSMVYADPSTQRIVRIGNANTSGSQSVSIGVGAGASVNESIAIGANAMANGPATLALGSSSTATQAGEISFPYCRSGGASGVVNFGPYNASFGYNNTNYRLLTGLYDPQSDHDAATKGYVDTLVDGKQDELTAGTGITIEEESGALVISSTGGGATTLTNAEFNAIFGTSLTGGQ